MPRPKSLRPSSPLEVALDETLRAKLDLHLWSTVEGRVPHGAYRKFFNSLLTQTFDHQSLDLAPYLQSLPGEAIVRAPAATIERLRFHLQTTPQSRS